MIGPASRNHFVEALAQIELLRGIAFAFLQDEVSLRKEDDE